MDQRRPLYAAIPLVTNIATTGSPANMTYHALQVTGRKRTGHGLEFVSSYTFSKTMTDNRGFFGSGGFVAGEGAYWQNAYDRRADMGRAFFDARHNFSVGGTLELPKAKSMGKAAQMILGGWKTSFNAVAHSGFPVTLLGRDATNQAVRGNVRANRYAQLTYQKQSIDNWFGTGNTFCAAGVNDGKCAYGDPAAGLFGNAGVGTEQAPSIFNFDASLGKQFKLREKMGIDFRAEFFNIFNHASFGPPGRSLATPATFGLIATQTTGPRNIQFGMKFFF